MSSIELICRSRRDDTCLHLDRSNPAENLFGTISSEHPGPDDDSVKRLPAIVHRPIPGATNELSQQIKAWRCSLHSGSNLSGFPEALRSFNDIERVSIRQADDPANA
jgi:hypothetical protein